MRCDAVLFDLDGTLVDSAPGITRALNAMRGDRGAGPLPVDAVRGWISLGADMLLVNALGPCGLEPAADLAAFREHLLAIPAEPADIYPEVPSALESLQAAGLRMAVVTNKPQNLSTKLLSDLGLRDFFVAVVGGDTTARPKPYREPMDAALKALQCPASLAVLVGDSIVDAQAARAVGMPFFLYEGGYGADECPPETVTRRFRRFGSLRTLLA